MGLQIFTERWRTAEYFCRGLYDALASFNISTSIGIGFIVPFSAHLRREIPRRRLCIVQTLTAYIDRNL